MSRFDALCVFGVISFFVLLLELRLPLREVINIHIRRDCLEPTSTGTVKDDDDGSSGDEDFFDLAIDLEKARPVSRLGYGQEYTVILNDFSKR